MTTRFIVVDGLDGCGKDTHARRIASLIESRGEKVTIISHPSNRRFGRISKKSLEGSGKTARFIATVFYIADVLVSVRMLRRQEGTVIFVRYLIGAAYLPKSLAPSGYKVFRNLLPFPDLAFYIDIDPATALRRIEERDHKREMFETEEKLKAVREIARSLLSDEWTVIDNSSDGEAPFKEVERILEVRHII
jgi:dTMP kinase